MIKCINGIEKVTIIEEEEAYRDEAKSVQANELMMRNDSW